MMKRHFGRFLLLPALALLAAFLFAACPEEEEAVETPTPPAATPTPAAIDISGVPELADGVLHVGSDIAYAPIEFFEAGSDVPQGVDIDLGNALGEALGVQVEFLNLGWDPLIPSLRGGEIDVIMSAMTITEERQQEIDFIPYFTAGTGILVPQGNPKGIETVADLCGLIVAVQVGTIQDDQIDDLNADACADNSITKQTFDENPLAVEQLRVGAADAVLADYPVVLYDALKSEGALEVAGEQFEAAPYGIGVRKESTALKQVLTDALVAIIENGTYDQILAQWGAEAGAWKEVAQ